MWNSASKAAYPTELNSALAKAFRLLLNAEPLPLDKYITREEPRAGHSVQGRLPSPITSAAPKPVSAEVTPPISATPVVPPAPPMQPPGLPPLSDLAPPPSPSSPQAIGLSSRFPGRPAAYVPEAERPTEERPSLPSSRTRYALRNAGKAQLAQPPDPFSASLMLLSKETPHDSPPSPQSSPPQPAETRHFDPKSLSLIHI